MVFVLTIDQRDSRHRADAVDDALARLEALPTRLGFERTVGDELQGLLDDPVSVVHAILTLMQTPGWHLGIGAGPVEQPLPDSVRSGRGPAFLAARAAVDRAKRRRSQVEVIARSATTATTPATTTATARDATAGCQLLVDLLQRRSDAGREAVEAARSGYTHAEIAARLGITRQAVSQRLRAARWPLEQASIPMLGHLLDRADSATRSAMVRPAAARSTAEV